VYKQFELRVMIYIVLSWFLNAVERTSSLLTSCCRVGPVVLIIFLTTFQCFQLALQDLI